MRVGNEDRKKLILAGVLGFVAIFAIYSLYSSLFSGPPKEVVRTGPPMTSGKPPVVVANTAGDAAPALSAIPGYKPSAGNAAVKVGSASGALDPSLHMEGMLAAESVVYSGTGRNIFASSASQAVLTAIAVKPKFPARPAPVTLPVYVAQGPPPPPPINLKFFGTATQAGVRKALLLSGEDVFLAAAGEIVQRRYKVVTISTNSITVEDMPNSNRQTLPLLVNQ